MRKNLRKFRATAINGNGDTFRFTFFNENWSGIDNEAKTALDKIVAADALHQKNGPWRHQNIDTAA